MPTASDNTDALQLAAQRVTCFAGLRRQTIPERAIGKAELEVIDKLRVIQAALPEVIERLRAGLQGLVVKVDHLGE